jgi:hypothetical protein
MHNWPERLSLLRVAVLVASVYVGWLVAFERWIEPLLRRACGVVLGCTIQWVPSGALRTWGTGGTANGAKEAAVALIGSVLVLCSSTVPVAVVHIASPLHGDGATGATTYLMSLPMMMLFTVWILRGSRVS